jgi:hypothetical protein
LQSNFGDELTTRIRDALALMPTGASADGYTDRLRTEVNTVFAVVPPSALSDTELTAILAILRPVYTRTVGGGSAPLAAPPLVTH